MTTELSAPTPDLRRNVESEERLVGIKMSVMGGANQTPLYSLASAADFLKIGTYEEAMRPNSQETIGYIDLGALEQWIRGVFGDEELADAIQSETAKGEAFGIVAPRIRELLQTRALQVAPERGAADEADEPANESEEL
ncbi:MAG: hypothetical protein ACYC6C_00765 [Coriobacteriia bacterium]